MHFSPKISKYWAFPSDLQKRRPWHARSTNLCGFKTETMFICRSILFPGFINVCILGKSMQRDVHVFITFLLCKYQFVYVCICLLCADRLCSLVWNQPSAGYLNLHNDDLHNLNSRLASSHPIWQETCLIPRLKADCVSWNLALMVLHERTLMKPALHRFSAVLWSAGRKWQRRGWKAGTCSWCPWVGSRGPPPRWPQTQNWALPALRNPLRLMPRQQQRFR